MGENYFTQCTISFLCVNQLKCSFSDTRIKQVFFSFEGRPSVEDGPILGPYRCALSEL